MLSMIILSLRYIYIYTYIYIHTYIYTYIHTYIHNTYIYTYIHTHVHIHVYIHTHVHTLALMDGYVRNYYISINVKYIHTVHTSVECSWPTRQRSINSVKTRLKYLKNRS